MTTELKIPQLGVSMEEGTLVEWLVEDGSSVESGMAIYVIETEKVETEIEAPVAGVIQLCGVPGVTYRVGATVATIE